MRANPDHPASSIILGTGAPSAIGIEFGLICPVTGAGVVVCVGVLILIFIAIELMKDEPFGPGNDLRVLGGKISDELKQSGKELAGFAKNPGKTTSDEWKKTKKRLGF